MEQAIWEVLQPPSVFMYISALCGAPHNAEIGAAWKKISKADRPYLSATLDDPSFPATIYARLVEGEIGAHNLIWSRSKGD